MEVPADLPFTLNTFPNPICSPYFLSPAPPSLIIMKYFS